jgi:agmatinase
LQGLASFGPLLAGADVVEVSPPYDPSGATSVAAANIAYELVGLAALAARG